MGDVCSCDRSRGTTWCGLWLVNTPCLFDGDRIIGLDGDRQPG
jgi:hypothetical protein